MLGNQDSTTQDQVSLNIAGKELVLDLHTIFGIDESDLSREFSDQPNMYAYYATKLADAEYAHFLAERDFDFAKAEADEDYREQQAKMGVKFTERVIESYVIRDEEVMAAQNKLFEAKRTYNALKYVVKALEQRADMLVSLGAHNRAEMGMTGMSIKEHLLDKSVSTMKETLKGRSKV